MQSKMADYLTQKQKDMTVTDSWDNEAILDANTAIKNLNVD